jgi:hypothetical protein
MNNPKSYMLATIGIVSLTASLTLNVVSASNKEASRVAASTAHFKLGKTYLLSPASGTSIIKCKVTYIDGAWLSCDANRWVNTNAMIEVTDSQ